MCSRDWHQEAISRMNLCDQERLGSTLPSRTNPETCLHNVIHAVITEKLELFVVCISCGSDRTDLEKRIGKNYEYDIDHNVWVHVPVKRTLKE